jgi:hypothetical protein
MIERGSAVAAAAVVAASAHAATYRLADHPDGSANPPPYGLRLDGIFGPANNGITTFSFDTFGDTIMKVVDTGSGTKITITGTVYGGRDTGSGYGFGEGNYAFSFTFMENVVNEVNGHSVTAISAMNSGSLIALGNNNGVALGTTYNLFENSNGTHTFQFLTDGHRLAGTDLEGRSDIFVGRGWLGIAGSTTSGTRDLLFVGELIPSPLGGAMAGVGLVGLAARRRR